MAEISARLKSVSPGAACQEFSLRYGLSFQFVDPFWFQSGSGSWSNFAVSPGAACQEFSLRYGGLFFLCCGSALVSVRIRIRDLRPPQVRQFGGSLPGILAQVWTLFRLLWIRTGFNADPDPRSPPASSPSVRGRPARSSHSGMDCFFQFVDPAWFHRRAMAKPKRICCLKKLILHEKYAECVGITGHIVYQKSTKAFLKGWKSCSLVSFGLFPCSRIRIRISNTDPDPGEPNQCGSGPDPGQTLLSQKNLFLREKYA
jgi:hypothetical protein